MRRYTSIFALIAVTVGITVSTLGQEEIFSLAQLYGIALMSLKANNIRRKFML